MITKILCCDRPSSSHVTFWYCAQFTRSHVEKRRLRKLVTVKLLVNLCLSIVYICCPNWSYETSITAEVQCTLHWLHNQQVVKLSTVQPKWYWRAHNRWCLQCINWKILHKNGSVQYAHFLLISFWHLYNKKYNYIKEHKLWNEAIQQDIWHKTQYNGNFIRHVQWI